MKETISPIIQVTELLELYESDELIIVDASNGENAKSNYENKHLDGAIFIDLNTQLAEIKDDLSNGGRHPLPKIENFSQTLSKLGISSKSHVVIYDDKNGSNASARFWWMLKAIVHNKVQVLNGGFQEAEKMNFPINSKKVNLNQTELYKIDNWKLPIAQLNEVEKVSSNGNHIVIDVREVKRFNGEFEPIDLIAGHIPGAINIPFAENLDKNGLFLSPNILKEKYQKIFGNIKSENIILHCGSGVTACHSLLAIAYANLEIPKLYVGSWSEWSRNNKIIATKTEKK
jgi:thiosulfate/3-mercaptopyruvate sulfurtransferase